MRPRRDFYAHAFVLLAIGSLVGLTGDRAPLAVADELLACLDTDFGAPAGHLEELPAVDPDGGKTRTCTCSKHC